MHIIKTDLKPFSAAHRLVKGYQGKCAHLHGHDYQVNLHIAAKALNALDLVVDFDDIKTLCNDWVQAHLDHGTLIVESDKPLHEFVHAESQKHFLIPDGRNSSVEALAEHLYHQFTELWEVNRERLNPEAFIHTVEVWESERSGAMYCAKGSFVKGDPCGA